MHTIEPTRMSSITKGISVVLASLALHFAAVVDEPVIPDDQLETPITTRR